MRAIGYRKSLPIEKPQALLAFESDKPAPAGTRDVMSAHPSTASYKWTSSGITEGPTAVIEQEIVRIFMRLLAWTRLIQRHAGPPNDLAPTIDFRPDEMFEFVGRLALRARRPDSH